MDGAILFSDIVVVLDALGRRVGFRDGEGPVLEPVQHLSDLNGLGPERIPEYLDPVYETLRRLSWELPPKTALIGFAGAPWTLAVYLVEGRGKTDCGRVKSWASEAPGDFRKVIDLLMEGVVAHMINQVKSGAEVLQLFDSWAGILDKKQILEWVFRPTATIVRRFRRACPGIPVIGFPRGIGDLYLDYVRETGVDGVNVDSTVPLGFIRDNLQPVCTVQATWTTGHWSRAAGNSTSKRRGFWKPSPQARSSSTWATACCPRRRLITWPGLHRPSGTGTAREAGRRPVQPGRAGPARSHRAVSLQPVQTTPPSSICRDSHAASWPGGYPGGACLRPGPSMAGSVVHRPFSKKPGPRRRPWRGNWVAGPGCSSPCATGTRCATRPRPRSTPSIQTGSCCCPFTPSSRRPPQGLPWPPGIWPRPRSGPPPPRSAVIPNIRA